MTDMTIPAELTDPVVKFFWRRIRGIILVFGLIAIMLPCLLTIWDMQNAEKEETVLQKTEEQLQITEESCSCPYEQEA